MELVGRYEERAQINDALASDKSELVLVYGRRRVGKTFFIREVLEKETLLQFTGLYESDVPEHMERFAQALSQIGNQSLPLPVPTSWFEAFDMLRAIIEQSRIRKKKVIFLDELPWMATHKSRFLTAFTSFWNEWASKRKDIVVVVCGSAASWMITNILKNKGGLHNRVTCKIRMEPFDLHETEQFLRKKGITLDRYDICQIYMVMGGIPFYLDQIKQGESATQAINRLCFRKKSILRLEYTQLFQSLFKKAERHMAIVEALAAAPRGMRREVLIGKIKTGSGGGLTKLLEELTESGFINAYIPFGHKKKDAVYKLTDHYTLFYLKYIAPETAGDINNWLKVSQSNSWASWSGLAFENLCMLHIEQIKEALGIDQIKTSISSWSHRGNDEMSGAQIDLLIRRADRIINMCEMKFSKYPYTIKKEYAMKMRQKMAAFEHFEKNNETIFPTIVTTYGLTPNTYSTSLIQNVVTLEDLFVKDKNK